MNIDDILYHLQGKRSTVSPPGILAKLFYGNEKEKVRTWISEKIEGEKLIELTGVRTIVIIYDPLKNGFEYAHFNVATGQPEGHPSEPFIPTTSILPASVMEVVYFKGCQPNSKLYGWDTHKQIEHAAGFLEKLMDHEAKILEIGPNEGNSFHRYFPLRKWVT